VIINPYRFAASAAADFGLASRDFVDTESDYLSLPSSQADYNFIHEDKIFTIALWVKLDNYNTDVQESIMGSTATTGEKGFFVGYNDLSAPPNDNRARLFIAHGTSGQNDQLIINQAVTDAGWHHWCFTGDGSTIKFYLDGSSFGGTDSVTYTGSYGNADHDLLIGADNTAGSPARFIDGNLADVRIYNEDIGATEVANLYVGTDYIGTNLVSHWIKNADVTTDYGSLGNDFTNNGTTWDADGPLD